MKNYLALVLGVMISASPAFASRARLESLGEGKNGSYYINDGRNIFLNPAQIVKHKKKMWLELGNGTVGAVDNTGYTAGTPGVTTSSRAQGGFTNTFGDFTYGAYMNNTSDDVLATYTAINAAGLIGLNGAITGANAFIAPDSQFEFFFAGESSVNWGVSLFYAGNSTRTAGLDRGASLLGARLGVDVNNFSIFTTVDITHKSDMNNATATVGKDEIKGKLGFDAGVTYSMDNMTLFGKYKMSGADAVWGTATTKTSTEFRNNSWGLGAGWNNEMTKSTNMFARVEVDMATVKAPLAANTAVYGETKSYNVPVVLGAESQALSWLAVRGSIAYSLMGQEWNSSTRNNYAGSTTVSTGVGMTFGDLMIDGTVASTLGGTAGALNTGSVPGFGTGGKSNANVGFGDNMISRVALTYNF